MKKISFLIDGFNLYHSVREAGKFFSSEDIKSLKWLDIKSLCKSYIPLIGDYFNKKCSFKEKYSLEKIYYFTSLAKHLQKNDIGKIERHKKYIECLEDNGLEIIYGRFKRKSVYCENCNQYIKKFEEKETDVAISSKLLELFYKNICDAVVLLTGDTDIIPAMKLAKSLFPRKKIIVCFPFNRVNKELREFCDFSFKINKNSYLKYQLKNPHITKYNKKINKPDSW